MSQIQAPKAPQAPKPVGGTTLVLISMAVALVTVVLVNFYIARIRAQVTESQISVFKLTRSVRPDDRLQARDIEEVPIPKRFKEAMDKLGAIDRTGVELRVTEKRKFRQSAGQGQILTFDLFDESGIVKPPNISEGMREIALTVNSKLQTGKIRPGHYVDIIAPFETGGEVPESLLVLERTKVVALGTQTIEESSSRTGGNTRVRSYHTITIQVTPDVALQMSMIQRMVPEFELHLRRSDDREKMKTKPGQISDRVKKILEQKVPRTLTTG